MQYFRVTEYGRRHRRVIFLMAGWTYQLWMLLPVAIMLSWRGYRCVVYAYDDSIFSPDYERTAQELTRVKKDVLNRIDTLKAEGCNSFYMLGTSLGSILAVTVGNESPDITKIIVNTIGADTARTVWSWDEVNPRFKQELLQRGATLSMLMEAWRPISPGYHVDHLHGKKLLVYLAKKDVTIPFEEGKQFAQLLEEHGIKHRLEIDPRRNHVRAGIRNLLRFKQNITFFDN